MWRLFESWFSNEIMVLILMWRGLVANGMACLCSDILIISDGKIDLVAFVSVNVNTSVVEYSCCLFLRYVCRKYILYLVLSSPFFLILSMFIMNAFESCVDILFAVGVLFAWYCILWTVYTYKGNGFDAFQTSKICISIQTHIFFFCCFVLWQHHHSRLICTVDLCNVWFCFYLKLWNGCRFKNTENDGNVQEKKTRPGDQFITYFAF